MRLFPRVFIGLSNKKIESKINDSIITIKAGVDINQYKVSGHLVCSRHSHGQKISFQGIFRAFASNHLTFSTYVGRGFIHNKSPTLNFKLFYLFLKSW